MTPDRRLLEHLVFVATLAPGAHRTPPWRLHQTANGLILRPGSSRGVPDPDPRQLALSCGAALHHLQVAARALGVDTTVVLQPEGDPTALAEVAFAIGGRPTGHDLELSVAAVERAASPRSLGDVEEADENVLDGLAWAAEQQGAELVLAHGLVVLTTPSDGTRDRLRAGMALSRVVLEATAAGLVAEQVDRVVVVPAAGVPQAAVRVWRAPVRRTAVWRSVVGVTA